MIVFQQGPHKSASSFCAQLLRAIAESHGYQQSGGHDQLGSVRAKGYVARLDEDPTGYRALPPYTVVKTHQNPLGARHLLEANEAVAFITWRDPLDCVQALLDHAQSTSGEARREFNDLEDPVEAAQLIMLGQSHALTWLRLPNAHAVHFDDLREDPQGVAERMGAIMDLPVDGSRIVRAIRKVRRFNVGLPGRGRVLLDGPDGPELARMFDVFYGPGRTPAS